MPAKSSIIQLPQPNCQFNNFAVPAKKINLTISLPQWNPQFNSFHCPSQIAIQFIIISLPQLNLVILSVVSGLHCHMFEHVLWLRYMVQGFQFHCPSQILNSRFHCPTQILNSTWIISQFHCPSQILNSIISLSQPNCNSIHYFTAQPNSNLIQSLWVTLPHVRTCSMT